MKIDIFCPVCEKPDLILKPTHLRDDGIYEYVCQQGHESVTILRELRYAILFDMALYAMQEGRYRDAVNNFITALERFYEFYITVICFKNGVDEELFQRIWKLVSRSSERQFGAYLFIYGLENKAQPIILSNEDTKLRNDVVHNGYIPEKEESIRFGKNIFALIFPVFKDLKSNYRNHMLRAYNFYIKQIREKGRSGSSKHMVMMSISTVLSLLVENPRIQNGSFESIMEYYEIK